MKRHSRVAGLLIVVEGLDGSGKSLTIVDLAGWLEQHGHRVRTIAWGSASLVDRAAADPRLRPALTPRVAALLEAADAQERVGTRVARRLANREIVLADRYAWTAIARDVARGLDLDWVCNLHRPRPAPAAVLYHRADPRAAVEQALAERPQSVRSAAIASAYGEFVGRLSATYELLVRQVRSEDPAPWPAEVVVLDPAEPAAGREAARDVVLRLIEARRMADG